MGQLSSILKEIAEGASVVSSKNLPSSTISWTGGEEVPTPPSISPPFNSSSVSRFMKGADVVITNYSLCPDKDGNIFLDEEPITNMCQVSNKAVLTTADSVDLFVNSTGIVNTDTYAYAKIIGKSNNTIYTEENYLNVILGQYKTSQLPTYQKDDILYQTINSSYYEIPNEKPVSIASNGTEWSSGGTTSILGELIYAPSGGKVYVVTQTGTFGSSEPTETSSDITNGSVKLSYIGLVWSSFMNSHAVWESNIGDSSCSRVYPNVYFPSTASYTFTYAIADTGAFYVDNASVASVAITGSAYNTTQLTTTITVSQGDHVISWSCLNSGLRGGVSLVITATSGGTVIFDSRTANADQKTKVYSSEPKFVGRVQNVQSLTGNRCVLAISPEYGLFNATANSELSIIKKVGATSESTSYSNVFSVLSGTTFPAGSTIKDADTLTISAQISSEGYVHRSGVHLPQTGTTTTTFYTTSNCYSLIGETLTITGGSGMGQSAAISAANRLTTTFTASITGDVLTVTSAPSGSGIFIGMYLEGVSAYIISCLSGTGTGSSSAWKLNKSVTGFTTSQSFLGETEFDRLTLSNELTGLSSNSRYSIGAHTVEEDGTLISIFNIPENEQYKFKTGDRQIVVTDAPSPLDNSYTMRSCGIFSSGPAAISATKLPTSPASSSGVATPVKTPSTNRTWLRNSFDPVAQTFMVPGANDVDQTTGQTATNYGMFVSSVDLWFSQKPDSTHSTLPAMVRIVEVQNGIPTLNVLAESIVQYKDINVPATSTSFSEALYTKFKFSDPVYLPPGFEYAIVVLSESPDYYVYVAQLGGTILGSERRVQAQPNMGSFFKSQNASTWTPIQDQDLVFRINRCKFATDTTGTMYFSPKNTISDIFFDVMAIHSPEFNTKPTSSTYFFKSKNVSGSPDLFDKYIPANYPYDFGDDSATSIKTSNRRRWLSSGDQNTLNSMNVGIDIISSDPYVSPILDKENLSITTYTSMINDGNISSRDISLINRGTHSNAANITISISSPYEFGGTPANAYVQALDTSGGIDVITVDSAGTGYHITPTISFLEHFLIGTITSNTTTVLTDSTRTGASAWTTNQWQGKYVEVSSGNGAPTVEAGSFVIGKKYKITETGTSDFTQIGAISNVVGVEFIATGTGNAATTGKAQLIHRKRITSSGTNTLTVSGWDVVTNMAGCVYKIIAADNATAVISGETSSSGGNCLTRYITKKVELADGFDAGDLKIYLDCIRPSGTNVIVYYKVKALSDSDPLDFKNWKKMNVVSDIYSKDQNEIIELEFVPEHDETAALRYFETVSTQTASFTATCSGNTLTVTGGDSLSLGMTVWSLSGQNLGVVKTVVGGGVYTLSIGGTFSTSQTMTAGTYKSVSYPLGGKFKQFAVKIVLTASDPTVSPTVTNFSAIATPSG